MNPQTGVSPNRRLAKSVMKVHHQDMFHILLLPLEGCVVALAPPWRSRSIWRFSAIDLDLQASDSALALDIVSCSTLSSSSFMFLLASLSSFSLLALLKSKSTSWDSSWCLVLICFLRVTSFLHLYSHLWQFNTSGSWTVSSSRTVSLEALHLLSFDADTGRLLCLQPEARQNHGQANQEHQSRSGAPIQASDPAHTRNRTMEVHQGGPGEWRTPAKRAG